jgi:membrane protease YdiL (CAAX protease family)
VENLKKPHVALWETALVFLLIFFAFIFSIAVVFTFFGQEAVLIIGELVILLVPLAYLRFKGLNIKDYVKIDFKPKYVLIGLICGFVMLSLDIIINEVLTYFLGTSTAVVNANQEYATLSTTPIGLAVVATALILAGICEEFAFRGFLLNSINRSLKPKYAAFAFPAALAISALIFGLFHFDLQAVYTIGAFTMGLVLGCFYQKWNYTVSATAHATMNTLFLVLLLSSV